MKEKLKEIGGFIFIATVAVIGCIGGAFVLALIANLLGIPPLILYPLAV